MSLAPIDKHQSSISLPSNGSDHRTTGNVINSTKFFVLHAGPHTSILPKIGGENLARRWNGPIGVLKRHVIGLIGQFKYRVKFYAEIFNGIGTSFIFTMAS